MTAKSTFELFNTATMSGVTPGTRTRRFQRLIVTPTVASAGRAERWALLAWQGVVGADRAKDGSAQAYALHLRAETGDTWTADPVFSLTDVPLSDLPQSVEASLAEAGWRLNACGSCHWLSASTRTNPDGIPAGLCCWRGDERGSPAAIELIEAQSSLALACTHWSDAHAQGHGRSGTGPPQMSLDSPAPAETAVQPHGEGMVGRLARWIAGRSPKSDKTPSWRSQLDADSSAVGTEACLACQGRVAKLGSVRAASAEGDRKAYSIWRCSTCFGIYLSCWIDRWARLDTLETDERLFRVSPAEAAEMLAWIDGVRSLDPAALGGRFDAYVLAHEPISHTVKHGR